jgi:hypothetical protein
MEEYPRTVTSGGGDQLIRARSGSAVAAYTERISDAIDVVEPGREQRDLQDASVVETDGAKPIVELRRDSRRVFRDLLDVLEHDAVLIAQLS